MWLIPHSLKGERGDKIKRGWVGLGVLVALTVFAYGYENGCQTAEILAINDEGEPSTCPQPMIILLMQALHTCPMTVVS